MNRLLDNKYARLYERLMARARGRQLEGYVEKHHVIPKSMGGTNSEVVALTYREHFIAHWLLTKCTDGKALHSMQYALSRMMGLSPGRRYGNVTITSWRYAVAKKAYVEARRARVVSPETREKMRAAMVGRQFTAEWVAKISASRRGQRLSDATRAKLSAANRGKAQSEDARKKNSAAHLGKKKSDETRARMSAGKCGHVTSEETKEKIRAGNLGKRLGAETRAKMSASRTGLRHSEETKAKMREAQKRRLTQTKDATAWIA